MRIIQYEDFTTDRLNQFDNTKNDTIDQTVLEIIQQVQTRGDEALFHYTEKLDMAALTELRVSQKEIDEAYELAGTEFLTALKQASENIARFHEAQAERSWFMNDLDGNMIGQKVTPLDSVGIYVPGGKAAYPSTVLMNVIPARLAGVSSISIATPPQPDGKVNPLVLAAAAETGADNIYKIGGAQAIAAFAYGTPSINKVAKIVGPGNRYVARAKKWVYGDVAIDMIAGPSEICVIADETANPKYAAADLLSQAEHDEAATAILITTSVSIAKAVEAELKTQIIQLDRKAIIEKSLADNGKIIVTANLTEAIDAANEIAPEHLQLMVKNPAETLPFIKNAGAIFLGPYSPEPLGDYFAGPNHTLPTSGTALFSSPLGVYDFMKKSSIIQYTQSSLLKAADSIMTLANAEGLGAHANAIQIRKDNENEKQCKEKKNS